MLFSSQPTARNISTAMRFSNTQLPVLNIAKVGHCEAMPVEGLHLLKSRLRHAVLLVGQILKLEV